MFGRSFRKLHKAIDKPYLIFGRKHRQFFHSYGDTVEVAKIVCPGDPVAQEAAILHVYVDNLCSDDPRLHERLKRLANEDSQNRKRAKKSGLLTKKGEALPAELKKVEKSCRQVLEIQKWTRLIRS